MRVKTFTSSKRRDQWKLAACNRMARKHGLGRVNENERTVHISSKACDRNCYGHPKHEYQALFLCDSAFQDDGRSFAE